MAAHRELYLFIHCDGWVRFGPYESLEYDSAGSVLKDQAGRVVASLQPGSQRWMIPGEKWVDFASDGWIITGSETLPRASLVPNEP